MKSSIASRHPQSKHSRSHSESGSSLNRKRKSSDFGTTLESSFEENRNENVVSPGCNEAFGGRSRWRRASMQMIERERQNNVKDVFLMCPDDSCRPPEQLIEEVDDRHADALFHNDASERCVSAFRTAPPKKNVRPKASPIGATEEALDSCDIYFFQRSTAWSEDWSDSDRDESVLRETFDIHEAIRQRLAAPDLSSTSARRLRSQSPIKPSARCRHGRSRRSTPERRQSVPLDIFRSSTPVTENAAEIFWEEKVLDVDDLEKMAKLSI